MLFIIEALFDLCNNTVEKWSPEQISGWLLDEKGYSLSPKTIYHPIWKDKKNKGRLYCHLCRKSKPYQSRAKKKAGRGFIKNHTGIEERPAVVDERLRLGDWELISSITVR